ncbi:tetratricopeptide repeat-containing sensor histidine kinase [Lunatimonas lonarensis]|nr:tetratricopeptide repeat protein [Lunatimonas lonarensis]
MTPTNFQLSLLQLLMASSLAFFWMRSESIHGQHAQSLDSLTARVNRYFDQNEYSEAISVLEEALPNARDSSELRKILADLGYAHFHSGQFDQSITFYTQAAEVAIQTGDTLRAARFIRSKGLSFQRLGLYSIALENYLQATQLVRNNGNSLGFKAEIHNSLGLLYQQLNDPKAGLSELKKAEEINITLGDTLNLARVWTNMAICYDDLLSYDSALHFNQLALTLKKIENDPKELASTFNNIAVNLLNLKRVDESEPYLIDSYRLHRQINDPEGIAVSLKNKADFALRKGDLNLSSAYLDSALILLESIKSQDYLIEALELQIRLFERIRNYERALSAYKRYDSLKASLFLEEKFNVQEIGNLYLLREKEFENEQVKTRASLLEIKNAQFEKTILLLGIIVLLTVTFGISTSRNLRTQKSLSNHIQKQNEIIKAQKNDLRHRLSNSLSRSQGIINSIARKIDDPEIKDRLQCAAQVLFTTSAFERHLIGIEDEKEVALGDFLESLIELQQQAIQLENRNILINFHCDSKIYLPVNQVISTSIIINEWITNSLKYAFPEKTTGQITVKIGMTSKGIKLEYMDNGKGRQATSPVGTGSQLNDLFIRDLRASHSMKSDHGIQHQLSFPIRKSPTTFSNEP